MNYKKTFERLCYFIEHGCDNPSVSEDAFNMAMDCLDAISKQIPEKPIRDSLDKAYLCPVCSNPFTRWRGYDVINNKANYCDACGQAIYWE